MQNKSIKIEINRNNIENMITDLEHGLKSAENFYRYYVRLATADKDIEESFELKQIARVMNNMESLICRAEKILADETFESTVEDANRWIGEWGVEQWFCDEVLNWYYMIPKNKEGKKFFDWKKSQYKYVITDLFEFHRFYVYDCDDSIVIA